jgi:DNA-binding transcriptional ArsR family regulator
MPLDAHLLTVISSPRRSEILRLVWNHELSAGEILEAMPDITPGAVSQQLKRLTDAGLLEVRTESRFRFYQARREALEPVAEALESMWSGALWKLKLAAELEESRRGPRPRKKRVRKVRKS